MLIMKKSELVIGIKVKSYTGKAETTVKEINGDIVILANGKEVTYKNMLKNYKKIGDPVKPEPKKEVKAKKAKKEVKAKKAKKEPLGDDRITLTDIIKDLLNSGKLPQGCIKEGKPDMKKIRRKLRSEKGEHIREEAVDKFRWEWTTDQRYIITEEILNIL